MAYRSNLLIAANLGYLLHTRVVTLAEAGLQFIPRVSKSQLDMVTGHLF